MNTCFLLFAIAAQVLTLPTLQNGQCAQITNQTNQNISVVGQASVPPFTQRMYINSGGSSYTVTNTRIRNSNITLY